MCQREKGQTLHFWACFVKLSKSVFGFVFRKIFRRRKLKSVVCSAVTDLVGPSLELVDSEEEDRNF